MASKNSQHVQKHVKPDEIVMIKPAPPRESRKELKQKIAALERNLAEANNQIIRDGELRTYWQNTDAERKARIAEMEKEINELTAANERRSNIITKNNERIAELHKENAELREQLAAAQSLAKEYDNNVCQWLQTIESSKDAVKIVEALEKMPCGSALRRGNKLYWVTIIEEAHNGE